MSIKDFQDKLDRMTKKMETYSIPLRIAAFDTTAIMGERIFDDGKDVDEDQISRPGYSTYSTKPIYVNPQTLKTMNVPGNIGKPIGKPIGKKKTGSRKPTLQKKKGELFAVETKRKTVYFATGYKGLRDKLGRRTDAINFNLSGELRMDFAKSKSAPAKPTKVNELEWEIRLDKPINAKKREGLEDKYGTVFSLSDNEREVFTVTAQREFNRMLSKAK